MRDIQDQMRADLARDRRSRPAARRTPSGAPRPIDVGPTWVVACFAGERPRFLGAQSKGLWTVALSPDRAQRFDDQAAAGQAMDDFQRRHAGSTHDAGSAWCVRQMTLTATFR